ncbi:DUF167 domain-containing protein [Candidatus Uhrbacteria bacterium]|nr:DUF167 domain-containing protein [Candidatus Uhrbacteria bacterium]
MILTVYAKPNARKNSLEWVDEDTLKISVTAAPEKGKANNAILELLSEELGIKKTAIEIVRGTTTRIKQIKINL